MADDVEYVGSDVKGAVDDADGSGSSMDGR